MFSKQEYINFVIADSEDTYFTPGAEKLRLKEYLWRLGHQAGYEKVYFLAGSNGRYSVSTFGDRNANDRYKNWLGQASDASIASWAKECLTDKGSCIIVCSLKDLVELLTDAPGAVRELAALRDGAGRTGIFVITAEPTADSTSPLILGRGAVSTVLEKLGEKTVSGIRSGALMPMYPALKTGKGEGCVFLDLFTADIVKNILLRAELECGSGAVSVEEITAAAEYISVYMRSPEFRAADTAAADIGLNAGMSFAELYELAKKSRPGLRLYAAADKVIECGGIEAYCAKLGCGCTPGSEADIRILRKRGTWAANCLTLSVLGDDPDGEQRKLIAEIAAGLSEPKNRLENRSIAADAESFFNGLHTARIAGDSETHTRILMALNFCVQNIYADSGSDMEAGIKKITASLNNFITLSFEASARKRSLAVEKQNSGYGRLADKALNQLSARVTADEKLLSRYGDAIKAVMLGLSFSTTVRSIEKLAEGLEECLDISVETPDVTGEDTAENGGGTDGTDTAAGSGTVEIDDKWLDITDAMYKI